MAQVQERLAAKTPAGVQDEVAKVLAQIAQAEAQLADAQWNLEQTVTVAPADGYVVALALAAGRHGRALPARPRDDVHRGRAVGRGLSSGRTRCARSSRATRQRSRSRPTPRASSSATSRRSSGRRPRASCRSAGCCRTTGFGAAPDMRLAVKLRPVGEDAELFLAPGARGNGAVYTEQRRRDPHPPQGVHAGRRQARLADPQAALTDMSARHTCLASAIAVVLAGCAVTAPPAPEEIRKDALQGTEIRASWSAGTAESGAIADYWLASFNDPQLNALVDEALARNPDLRAAAARVEQVGGLCRYSASGPAAPVNLLGTGGLKVGGGSDLTSALQGAMLGISWEPDLWGRLRYGRNAADESYASTRADYEFARQSMAAPGGPQLVPGHRGQAAVRCRRAMAQSSREIVRLAADREKVGVGSHRDVALARANLGTFEDAAQQVAPRLRAGSALARVAARPLSGGGAAGRAGPARRAGARPGRDAARHAGAPARHRSRPSDGSRRRSIASAKPRPPGCRRSGSMPASRR